MKFEFFALSIYKKRKKQGMCQVCGEKGEDTGIGVGGKQWEGLVFTVTTCH